MFIVSIYHRCIKSMPSTATHSLTMIDLLNARISIKVIHIHAMTRCMIGHTVEQSTPQRACVMALSSVQFPYFYVSTDRIPIHAYTFIPFKKCFGSPLSCIIITLFRYLLLFFSPISVEAASKQLTNDTISLIDHRIAFFCHKNIWRREKTGRREIHTQKPIKMP